MKPSIYRRMRRRPVSNDIAVPKKDNQQDQQFFGETTHEPFFKPVEATQQNVQRKCADCEKDDKAQRSTEKKEEEKVMKKEEKKEEKVQRVTNKKEEDKKVQKKEDKKEEEKVMKKEEKKEEEKIHKKEGAASTTNTATPALNYIGSINSKGKSMDAGLQSFYENRIGVDFSNVKIHTGKEAAESAKDLNAQAYAYGNHIVFNEDKYNPDTSEGKHLLAHELTHVVQQDKSGGKIQREQIGDLREVGTGVHYKLDSTMKTFSQLAGYYGVSVTKIQAANPGINAGSLSLRQLIYIPITDPPSAAPSVTGAKGAMVMSTTSADLNVRWGSSSDANIIGTITRGTSVRLLAGNKILIVPSSLSKTRAGAAGMLTNAGYVTTSGEYMGYLPSSSNVRLANAAISTSDTDLLARMIWGEERSQGHAAMLAAGWVAMNRYKIGWGTFSDILNNSQFHGIVTPGQVQGLTGSDSATWTDAQTIAQGIVAGTIADTTGGFLYFGNGSSMMEMMKKCQAKKSSFRYSKIGSSNLYISNLDYTGC